jgi:hypothetical protein
MAEELMGRTGPSVAHFCDMLWSPDYQRVNKKDRLPVRVAHQVCISSLIDLADCAGHHPALHNGV